VVVEVASGIGEGEAARGAVDQQCAEPRFKLGDALADGRLRAAEPARGGREPAAVDCLDEEVQVVEVEHQRSMFVDIESIFASLLGKSPRLYIRRINDGETP
jgi:hypothetical protein